MKSPLTDRNKNNLMVSCKEKKVFFISLVQIFACWSISLTETFEQNHNILFFLLFLLFVKHILPVCFCLLFLFLHLLPFASCWLCLRAFDHGFGRLLACSLQGGFDAQIVNVVCSHANIDHWLEGSVCGLACVITIPSPRITWWIEERVIFM